ncbi:MAG: hypothetical protein HRU20_32300 [Pseudomonadales bacterium]|nr:hypothetical protein [Pseudomonadales bacterium]
MLLIKLSFSLGILVTLLSSVALIISVMNITTLHTFAGISQQGFLLMAFLQLIVGLFLSYASQLKLQQVDIAEKLYPSSIAAQILLALMWRYGLS